MDIILIRQLRVETIIGVLSAERQFKQKLLLDLDLETDAAQVANTDTLTHAIDYANVCQFIQTFAQTAQYQMIETFAQQLSEALFQNYPMRSQKITVFKPGAVIEAQTIGISIERRRK